MDAAVEAEERQGQGLQLALDVVDGHAQLCLLQGRKGEGKRRGKGWVVAKRKRRRRRHENSLTPCRAPWSFLCVARAQGSAYGCCSAHNAGKGIQLERRAERASAAAHVVVERVDELHRLGRGHGGLPADRHDEVRVEVEHRRHARGDLRGGHGVAGGGAGEDADGVPGGEAGLLEGHHRLVPAGAVGLADDHERLLAALRRAAQALRGGGGATTVPGGRA